MDVHVPRPVLNGLRLRHVDVLTAQEDNGERLGDAELLDRANRLGRVLFSQEEDLFREAAPRQRSGEAFVGVIYGHQLRVSIGQCISDLELIAKVGELKDLANRVEYLRLSQSS